MFRRQFGGGHFPGRGFSGYHFYLVLFHHLFPLEHVFTYEVRNQI